MSTSPVHAAGRGHSIPTDTHSMIIATQITIGIGCTNSRKNLTRRLCFFSSILFSPKRAYVEMVQLIHTMMALHVPCDHDKDDTRYTILSAWTKLFVEDQQGYMHFPHTVSAINDQ